MAITYSKTSLYYATPTTGNFLDLWQPRNITKNPADVVYTIDQVYQHRPDLLAFDLYGDQNFWWVFAARNPNVLKDPIFDFYAGITIFLPKKENLLADLGL